MKASLCIWREKPANLPEWFKDRTYTDVTLQQIQELFELKINTMILHKDEDVLIYVDTKSFRQG